MNPKKLILMLVMLILFSFLIGGASITISNMIVQGNSIIFMRGNDFLNISFETQIVLTRFINYTLDDNRVNPFIRFVIPTDISGNLLRNINLTLNITTQYNHNITEDFYELSYNISDFEDNSIYDEEGNLLFENITPINRTYSHNGLISTGGDYWYKPEFVLNLNGQPLLVPLNITKILVNDRKIKYRLIYNIPTAITLRQGDVLTFLDPLVTQCTNLSATDTLDLNAPIFMNFANTCFKLNYSGTILDGHGINLTTAVVGAVVVNITNNVDNIVVRGMNISTGSSTTSSFKINVEANTSRDVTNVTIFNNTINSINSDAIRLLGNNLNFSITENKIITTTGSVPISSVNLLYSNISNNNLSTAGANCIKISASATSFDLSHHNTISNNICNQTLGTNGDLISLTMTHYNIIENNNVRWHLLVNTPSGCCASALELSSGTPGTPVTGNIIRNNNFSSVGNKWQTAVTISAYVNTTLINNKITTWGSVPTFMLGGLAARNLLSINNTYLTNNIGIAINATISINTVPRTNFTFINDTIAPCDSRDGFVCNVSNITADIMITGNVTNVFMKDVRFNKTKIVFNDLEPDIIQQSNISVQWTLDLNVTDTNGAAITTAFVQINDSKGTVLVNTTVNNLGFINSTLITEFTQNGSVVPFYQSCTEQLDERSDPIANFSCKMPLNISVTATNYNSQTFSFYLNKTNKTIVVLTAPDATAPTVTTTFNITNPTSIFDGVINFTGNITDDVGLISANITYNISGSITYVNFTITGTSAEVSNVTKLCSSECVINFTMFATDTSNNVRQSSTLIEVLNRTEFTYLVNGTQIRIFNATDGTFDHTKIVGLGISSNVTLNDTSTFGGFPVYSTTGNYTSEVMDTESSNSIFDRITWASDLFNSSDVMAFIAKQSVSTFGLLLRNGTMIINNSVTTLSSTVEFVGSSYISYLIPSDFSYDDIIDGALDEDSADQDAYLFMVNGTVLMNNSANFNDPMNFTEYSTWDIPADINVSNIVGIMSDTTFNCMAILLKNGTSIASTGDNAPFTFSSFSTYNIASGFNRDDIIGANNHIGADDYALFFRNGSMLVDLSQGACSGVNYAAVRTWTTPSNINVTTTTNITLQTRASNDTATWTPWSSYYTNSNGSQIEQTTGRYIQYKAIFFTPDKYITPALENVSINYTFVVGGDATAPTLAVSFNISLSSVFQGSVINATANASDETGLSIGTWISNQSGINEYFNFSLSGLTQNFSQTFIISQAAGTRINLTAWANDTSNNKAQVENVFTVTTEGAGDTCTYGGTGDWGVLCSDNCVISSDVTGQLGKTFSIGGNGGTFIANNIIKGFSAYMVNSTNCDIKFNKGRQIGRS